MSMFCFQCEQAAGGKGCVKHQGVCGKDRETAALQDLLLFITKGTGSYAHHAARLGSRDPDIDRFVMESLFTTVTNVNFDPVRLEEILRQAVLIRARARKLYEDACRKNGTNPETLQGPALLELAADRPGLMRQGEEIAIPVRHKALGEDILSLQELIAYGLKGVASYADHAQVLGKEDPEVYAFFHEALAALSDPSPKLEDLLALAHKVGEVNLKVMGLLDQANTSRYGHPTPTKVRTTPKKGHAILVSGHDLLDLEELLKQSAGKGINVYTHGEMLPCHGYPGLKKYPHLAGNYGSAWQNQAKEFDEFPGSILMTTNCIQKPRDTYKNRIFTSGLVAWPGVKHIDRKRDFSPVIKAALAEPGFAADGEDKSVLVGFGHNAVLGVAGKVVDAVKAGKIRHFFLIGGCDGAKPGRNYYTELALAIPKDCVILTLACGKYRFINEEFGDIEGIPRLLDIGQCNDAYSAIQIAVALAGAFKTDVNSLPLSLVLSWYEQKAVCILLTLLHLGIKKIRLGPSLPAFVSPAVLKVLVDNFGIAPISTPEKDLKAMLG